MSDDKTIEELIEASSLGTPAAKAARASVPHSTGVAIALAARYLGERNALLEDLRELAERPLARHSDGRTWVTQQSLRELVARHEDES